MMVDSSSGVGVALPGDARWAGLEGGFVPGTHVVVQRSSYSREWRRARGLCCWPFTRGGCGKAWRGSTSAFGVGSSSEDVGGREMSSEGGDGASRCGSGARFLVCRREEVELFRGIMSEALSCNLSEAKGLNGSDAESVFEEVVYVGAGANPGGTEVLDRPRKTNP